MNSQQRNLNVDNDDNNKIYNNFSYKLYAVINHHGQTLEQGHYSTYIRTVNDNWFLVNDAQYRPVPRKEIFYNENAFVLFYAKTLPVNAMINITSQQKSLSLLPIQNHVISQLSPLLNFLL
jgi:ubiquitin C-terminal hydrolase